MSDILTLSLTGPESHRLERSPGMGSLIMGPADGLQRPDVAVAPDETIDWHAFDGMQAAAGSHWPRFLHYEGNDTSLFAWMRERQTEDVLFVACADLDLDIREAKLGGLTLWPRTHRIAITLRLSGLELRYIPDLEGLPDLAVWPELGYFIAWNVDESAGKALRQAVKRLPAGEGNVARVSQLRSRQWFIEEHGLPFAGWTGKNEKAASKAYKAASKVLGKSTAKKEAKAAIAAFVETINGLAGVETSERDDCATAVALLARVKPGLISEEEALAWFDEVRDF